MSRLPLPYADKSLGQHFLKDEKIISKICSDHAKIADAILEIGPGPGILTEFLSAHQLPFCVIEKDLRFKEYLEQFIVEAQIHFEDALKVDLEKFIHEYFKTNQLWLVSNLPYNVGSPLFVNFLQCPSIKLMTLMFQKEVAEKIYPFSQTKNVMNSLLVLAQTYFECSLLIKAPPGAFSPPPKVDSAVISFKRHLEPVVPLSEFNQLEKFLRLMFSQKRKQLKGILKTNYPINLIEATFNELNISLDIRAEALSFDQVILLYRKFKK